MRGASAAENLYKVAGYAQNSRGAAKGGLEVLKHP